MKIIIAGGTGFIGQALIKHFLSQQHAITVIGRKKHKIEELFGETVQAMTWKDLSRNGLKGFGNQDLIINLAGSSIGKKPWSKDRKQKILSSRVRSSQILARLCAAMTSNSPTLFNASAVGVYGLQEGIASGLPAAYHETTRIDFNSAPDFLAHVARQWELAVHPAMKANVRMVILRFGMVLGKGGVLTKLALPYKLGLGGKIGSGNQPISWIALPDLIRIFDFLINHPEIKGPINCVAPECVKQKEFAQTMGKILHRPTFLTMPASIVKLFFGEMGEELLLKGQCVTPDVLQANNFEYQFPTLEAALRQSFE